REAGEVGLVADRAVALLVLVVAGGGHPRPVPGRAGVVREEGVPGAHPVIGDVGVAEVSVEQVEERLYLLDAAHDVRGGWRGQTADAGGVRTGSGSGQPGDGRHGLVAEAGEGERYAAGRCGTEGACVGQDAVAERCVNVRRVRAQVREVRVVDVDLA